MMVIKQQLRILLSILCLLFICQVHGQDQEVIIKGSFKNWPKTRDVVFRMLSEGELIVDTILVKNGKFKYKRSFVVPVEVGLSYEPPLENKQKDHCRFYIDKGEIFITHSDSLRLAQITGPATTMDFEKFKKEVNPLREKMVAIRIKAQDILRSGGSKQDLDEIEEENQHLVEDFRATCQKFITENPNSLIALEVIKQLDGTSYSNAEVFKLFQGLNESVKQTEAGLTIAESFRIGMKTSLGTLLEEFTSLDTSRKPLTLGEVKAKGRLTLVDFWASWCKPCRAENPNLRKVYGEFHDKGFNIIAVSLDRSEAAWKNAIRQDQLPWYHVSSLKYWDEPIVKQFGISGVPDSFLLDSAGRIIGRGLRGDKLYEAVKLALTR
ncbi:Thiol-disulfide isomerase or thioredoxin [Sphingobacterium nematocida]|uniref:Thiol-disulfide isomerase or thioredoxin n=1 Tax=Sphingobacterium nematocida TaxID=1513896 RepID=A0A1T5AV28_9SPHI|nr:TlpA disulfide reductase family protein [Sphingobacterium nematocida]SKB38453.1 Thiol-disulfide isomerase or thioredoxin [Sphingobacterium nematocida]